MHLDKDSVTMPRTVIGAFKYVANDSWERWEKDTALEKIVAGIDDYTHQQQSYYRKKARSGSGWDENALGTLLYGGENLRKRAADWDQED